MRRSLSVARQAASSAVTGRALAAEGCASELWRISRSSSAVRGCRCVSMRTYEAGVGRHEAVADLSERATYRQHMLVVPGRVAEVEHEDEWECEVAA